MTSIINVLKMSPGRSVQVNGWIRSFRGNRFIALNDGSCMTSLQIVINPEDYSETLINSLNTGASIFVEGELIESLGSGQKTEIQAKKIDLIGKTTGRCSPNKMCQKTFLEKLREQAI